jgi:hypothetical protein
MLLASHILLPIHITTVNANANASSIDYDGETVYFGAGAVFTAAAFPPNLLVSSIVPITTTYAHVGGVSPQNPGAAQSMPGEFETNKL